MWAWKQPAHDLQHSPKHATDHPQQLHREIVQNFFNFVTFLSQFKSEKARKLGLVILDK
jgi:hypothetical protein